jgi:flagellar hook-associated protein 3 FlgL
MTRVATVPLQHIMAGGMQRAQQVLTTSQTQLATGKKAPDFASLGTDGIRNMSAHSLAARQTAYEGVATRLGTTLSLYDAHLGAIDTAASTLRDKLMGVIGTGQAIGLGNDFETAFGQVGASLNASIDGQPLFAGAQTGIQPFKPANFAAMAGLAPADAFANDNVRGVARLGDGVDVTYGMTASDVAQPLMAAFRTLADAGPIGNTPTTAQMAAITQAIGQIDQGLATVRAQSADNGQRQALAETMATRASDRGGLLNEVISNNEDADLGQIAIDIAQNKAVLQASYSVFSQLAGLNLGDYLR